MTIFLDEINSISLNLQAKLLRVLEDKVIDMLLKQGLTKTEVANMLGISRTALWKKINK